MPMENEWLICKLTYFEVAVSSLDETDWENQRFEQVLVKAHEPDFRMSQGCCLRLKNR